MNTAKQTECNKKPIKNPVKTSGRNARGGFFLNYFGFYMYIYYFNVPSFCGANTSSQMKTKKQAFRVRPSQILTSLLTKNILKKRKQLIPIIPDNNLILSFYLFETDRKVP